MKTLIEILNPVVQRLKEAKNPYVKLDILGGFEYPSKILQTYCHGLQPECLVVIKSLIAAGQGENLFSRLDELPEPFEALRSLVQSLIPVEKFYEPIGGLVGYHLVVLQLILQKQIEHEMRYLKPEEVDISKETPEVLKFIRQGIEALPQMAEIYPVGGAGDRLNLVDEASGEPLPAGQLLFMGRTLLEGLVRDLQAREWLVEKLNQKTVITPILLMTSDEKHNDQRMREICERNAWFGRPKESFFFINQPLVPVITSDGVWALKAPLQLLTKPGGHGAIWKLAIDSGAIEWLKGQNRTHALVRQINNPIAGTDAGLLAFVGVGIAQKKAFGFASCSRLLNTAEGMVVLVEEGGHYHLGCVEYTDFAKHGIEDVPDRPGSPYSAFPANTNLLFVDIDVVEEAAGKNPIPGMLINLKTKNSDGTASCRLESLMQAVADEIVDPDPKALRSYLTHNTREKTISVTKQSHEPGKSVVGTPEGALYDQLKNARELLRKCEMGAPGLSSFGEPPFLFSYHPALGPLYSIISQKVLGGELMPGAELQLEIAELLLHSCRIQGSLLIRAESFKRGRCYLYNVVVRNKGIDRSQKNIYWKNQIKRHEAFEIILQGESEFFAEDLELDGDHKIEVPHGHRTIAYKKEGRIFFRTEKIATPSWSWNYSFHGDSIVLKLEKAAIC